MNINLADIENRILQSKDDFKNITIRNKVFKKDTQECGYICGDETHRFTLHYEKDGKNYKKSFFMKVPYKNPQYEEFKKLNIYSREVYMHTVLFPQFDLLLPNNSLHPEFYGTDGGDVLILDDLSQSDYQNEKNSQLNSKQFIVALKQLAKFHALGVKVQERQPQILNDMKNAETPPIFDLFSSPERKIQAEKQFRDIVDRVDQTFASKHPEVLFYFDQYLRQMSKDVQKSDDKLNVLNHGNIHTKNIWFAHNNVGEVVDAKFTNFRYCHYGSPITDLISFIVTSLPFEVFEQTFDELLEVYASNFNATLERLKCDQKLSVDELRGKIDLNYEYFLYFLIGVALRSKEVSDTRSDEFAPKKYVDEESYDKLSELWMSHIIKKGIFSKHEDIAIAIHTFIRTFEAENKTTVLSYDLDRTVVKPGENFCSLIVRLKFEYNNEEEITHGSVLLKIPSLSLNYDGLKETNVYNQEIFIYQKIFAEMYQGWKEQPLVPICYTISEAKILVLEDLSIQGYRLCDKLKQLDLDHCRVALATMAKHHAISLKYVQRCDEAIRAELKHPFNVTSTVRTLSQKLYAKFLRVMKPLVTDSLHHKMEALKDKLPKDAIYGRYMDDSGLNVLGHCDYWTNNILFQYNKDGHVCSAKIIDWQLSRLASPVIDLIFFFITSVRFEIFETYKDTLLDLYLDTFNKTLSGVDSDLVYTRSDLDEAFRRYKYYFWLYVGTELPFVMGQDGCFDNEVNSDSASEYYLSVAQKWVNYLEKENLM